MSKYVVSVEANMNSYIVIYRTKREQVEIVAVTQGARDIPSFLQRRYL